MNYEPSITGGLREAQGSTHTEQGPDLNGKLTRSRIPVTNDYQQAGERYQLLEQWEKDDLVANFVANISETATAVQERMLWHFYMVDDELGARVGEGLDIPLERVASMEPLETQTLSEDEVARMRNLGHNGARDVSELTMTHCVPNEHVTVSK